MDAEKTGAYLAVLRRAKGWTQQEIADRLGVSNKTVSKWESGGGFPDITVLPALAEVYGVTADDILAGETLTERRRERLSGPLTAQKRRLLSRLRLRFNLCFVLSLALAVVGWLNILYVSPTALVLSAAALWIGYLLLDFPLRDELPEERAGLAPGLWRKLAVGTLMQWAALVRLLPALLWVVARLEHISLYLWKPQIFLVGAMVLWVLFAWLLRRAVGTVPRLVPTAVAPWLIWGAVSYILWQSADTIYELYGNPLEFKIANAPPQLKEEAAQIFGARLRPYRLLRQGALAIGSLSGVGLAAFRLKKAFQKKAPLARKDESC